MSPPPYPTEVEFAEHPKWELVDAVLYALSLWLEDELIGQYYSTKHCDEGSHCEPNTSGLGIHP